MPAAHLSAARSVLAEAANLLNQQTWCWGRDVVRPEGNWLLKVGFDRIKPPPSHGECASVYTLNLPHGRCVVLRGFGLFYGDHQRGGVFLPRFEFRPRYTKHATLECPPWSDADLPKLAEPKASQRERCLSLAIDAIEWIRAYEERVQKTLGIEYRRLTLTKWDNGRRAVLPAEEMVPAWKTVAMAIAEGSEQR